MQVHCRSTDFGTPSSPRSIHGPPSSDGDLHQQRWPNHSSTPDLPWRSTSSPSGIIQRPSGHGSIKKSGREQKSPNGRHQTDLDSKQIDGENLIENIRQKTHPIADLKSKQGSRQPFFRHHPIQAWWGRQQNPPDPAIMEQRSERVCLQSANPDRWPIDDNSFLVLP
ncbi:hypothetical protein ACLOJK_018975 [Asimina triloba]